VKAPRFAYLHGFASSSRSYKGARLAETFAAQALEFELPDLNCPSFETMTYTAILAFLDDLYREDPRPFCLVGSSMGGYLAARWAQLHPEKVARLVLLCPAFDLPGRWEKDNGKALMDAWRSHGSLRLPDASGELKELWWHFIEDARTHPTHPEVDVPTLIIHGTRDPTVPIESSRRYAKGHSQRRLIEVDDDHGLASSIELIRDEVLTFFRTGADGLD